MIKKNKKKIYKNQKKRWCFRDLEVLSKASYCLLDCNFPLSVYSLDLIPLIYCPNICLSTASSKKVYRKFRLSRHAIRYNALFSNISGLQKSLW